jgi:hypothetical protein
MPSRPRKKPQPKSRNPNPNPILAEIVSLLQRAQANLAKLVARADALARHTAAKAPEAGATNALLSNAVENLRDEQRQLAQALVQLAALMKQPTELQALVATLDNMQDASGPDIASFYSAIGLIEIGLIGSASGGAQGSKLFKAVAALHAQVDAQVSVPVRAARGLFQRYLVSLAPSSSNAK